ncbi:MAG: hypothetical protein ACLT33_07460 [Lachnospira pectinoschiza]
MLNKHTAFQVAIDGITSEVSKVKVDIRDNYSTTTQMISRIVQEIKDDKSTISSSLQATYATQKYADDAANAATSGLIIILIMFLKRIRQLQILSGYFTENKYIGGSNCQVGIMLHLQALKHTLRKTQQRASLSLL